MAAAAAAAAATVSLVVLFLPSLFAASPYLSPTTLVRSYQNMVTNFRIFIYTCSPNNNPFDFPTDNVNATSPSSLFYDSLLRSPFLARDPTQAHLFFVPFSPHISTRALARLIRELRNTYPYWNRTLGADHFFLSPAGIDYSSDRNVLELKKNSVQISLFPVVSGFFVPHKDITLPPLSPSPLAISHDAKENSTQSSFLGYLIWDGTTEPNLVNELKGHSEFFVEEKSEPLNYLRPVKESRFCLFLYRGEGVWAWTWLVGAMAQGCVPVVIVHHPIQDLPLMDILRWSDLAFLVEVLRGGTGGAERLKQVLNGVSEDKYAEMRELGVAASKHLTWNEVPQPLDAFHMVMYQLWLRRHVVRYARREPL